MSLPRTTAVLEGQAPPRGAGHAGPDRPLLLRPRRAVPGRRRGQKVQIIDEFTGRVMADRSWRHGLHQAIEVKEDVTVTADKENLARLSFQRFFRQYPIMARHDRHRLGVAPASSGRSTSGPVVRIPTNKPCIRKQLPVRMFDTMDAEVGRGRRARLRAERQGRARPRRHAQRAGSARKSAGGWPRRAGRTACSTPRRPRRKRRSSPRPGSTGKITVATNMAGRGTDIKLARGVADLGGLHVISTEPHGSGRVDRQLFGRAARQGDPGCAQMFASAEDDLFLRHAPVARRSLARHRRPQAHQTSPRPGPNTSPASTASRSSRATTGWTRACRSDRTERRVPSGRIAPGRLRPRPFRPRPFRVRFCRAVANFSARRTPAYTSRASGDNPLSCALPPPAHAGTRRSPTSSRGADPPTALRRRTVRPVPKRARTRTAKP